MVKIQIKIKRTNSLNSCAWCGVPFRQRYNEIDKLWIIYCNQNHQSIVQRGLGPSRIDTYWEAHEYGDKHNPDKIKE